MVLQADTQQKIAVEKLSYLRKMLEQVQQEYEVCLSCFWLAEDLCLVWKLIHIKIASFLPVWLIYVYPYA